MQDDCVLWQVEGGVATVTLNRPDRRNAIDQEMVDALHRAFDALEPRVDVDGDETVRALVLTGAGGRAFAAGADIAQLVERRAVDALRRINQALFNRVEAFPMPTVAAIEGYCLGGGCELALCCDLRVAAVNARLGQPEVGLGIIPGAGGPRRLVQLLGPGRARELIFTGALLGAEEALAVGLVNRLANNGEALQAARALAAQIATQAPLALRVAKIAINAGLRGGGDLRDAVEFLGQATLFESDEKRRRMTAFLERKAEARKEGA
jgi:enoyl-CoA hydratase